MVGPGSFIIFYYSTGMVRGRERHTERLLAFWGYLFFKSGEVEDTVAEFDVVHSPEQESSCGRDFAALITFVFRVSCS